MTSIIYRSCTLFFCSLLFICFVRTPLEATDKKKICLHMVVKNEGGGLKKCLNSVRPYIDYWVIVDLGSVDGTKKIVQECLQGIPGELIEKEWEGVEKTYTSALQLAASKAEYVFCFSGDEYLECDPKVRWPDLSHDVYNLTWVKNKKTSLHRQLIKSSLPWHWRSGLYPYLTCDKSCSESVLDGVRCVIREGSCSEEDKFGVSGHFQGLQPEKGSLESQKIFRYATEYFEAGDLPRALEWYQKHILVAQDRDEIFLSLVQIAHLEEELGYPLDIVMAGYYRAYRFCPGRMESVYYLARLYNKQNKYDLAYDWIHSRSNVPLAYTGIIPVVNIWMEEWGLPFELSVCAYWVGRYQESLEVSDALLKVSSLPGILKRQCLSNREYALKKLPPKPA